MKYLKKIGFILENLNSLDSKKNKEELHSFSQYKLKNIYYDGGMINV